MAAVRVMEDRESIGNVVGVNSRGNGFTNPIARTGVTTIEPSDLILGEKLGAGSFGAVYRGNIPISNNHGNYWLIQ